MIPKPVTLLVSAFRSPLRVKAEHTQPMVSQQAMAVAVIASGWQYHDAYLGYLVMEASRPAPAQVSSESWCRGCNNHGGCLSMLFGAVGLWKGEIDFPVPSEDTAHGKAI